MNPGIVFAVVEFCSRGSLEGILRAKRRALYRSNYFNPIYTIPGCLGASTFVKNFSTYELLTFCRQVCSAMEYLGSKRVFTTSTC